MIKKNWNCDGAHCTDPNGEVRTYPLGGGANLILCIDCVRHENRYRKSRGEHTQRPADFPQPRWNDLQPYGAKT
jgi:hypothetical protein